MHTRPALHMTRSVKVLIINLNQWLHIDRWFTTLTILVTPLSNQFPFDTYSLFACMCLEQDPVPKVVTSLSHPPANIK
jgi:hypothetical protein